jgi:hypothetical protein
MQVVSIHTRHSGLVAAGVGQDALKKIRRESRIVALEVLDIECGVQRPEILLDEKYFAECSVTAGNYPGTPYLGGVMAAGHV